MNFDEFSVWFYNYKWMEFILACIFTVVIAVIAYNYNLDLLGPFAAMGLIVIGYISHDKIIGSIMGGVGALPIALAIHSKILGPINISMNYFQFIILVYISIFVMGAIVGFIGSLVYFSRKKSIEERVNKKNSKKNRKTSKNIKK